MNNEQLMSNLSSVRQEVRGIVDNIRAIRGDKHAALTMAFLHASTLTDITRLLAASSDLPEEALERVRNIYLHCLSEAIRGFLSVSDMSSDQVGAAITEASSVENSLHSMSMTAWNMAEEGRSYGGSD